MKEETNQKYQYCTKVLTLPNGRRKYVRGKTKEELDAKLKRLEELAAAGVRIYLMVVFDTSPKCVPCPETARRRIVIRTASA